MPPILHPGSSSFPCRGAAAVPPLSGPLRPSVAQPILCSFLVTRHSPLPPPFSRPHRESAILRSIWPLTGNTSILGCALCFLASAFCLVASPSTRSKRPSLPHPRIPNPPRTPFSPLPPTNPSPQ